MEKEAAKVLEASCSRHERKGLSASQLFLASPLRLLGPPPPVWRTWRFGKRGLP